MKKILLASTAVVLTAGAAAADNANVSFNGYVRFGVQYNDNALLNHSTTLEKRVRLNIDIKKMSDAGMEMGARIRVQGDETTASTVNSANAYVKMNGFTLRVGNIGGAIENMPGLYDGDVGLTGLAYDDLVTNSMDKGYWAWDAYDSTGAGNNGMEVVYTAGGFTGWLSHSRLDQSTGLNRTAGFLAYTFGDWTVAVAHQSSDISTEDKTVVTIGGKIGDFAVGIAGADNDGVNKFQIHGSYTMDALTLNGYVANDDSVLATDTSYGIGASYDIGGASLIGGVAKRPNGDTRADFGIKFSF